MAQQKETRFSAKFAKELAKIPGVWWCKIQQVTKHGDPDYLICAGGMFMAAELKTEEGRPTPLQQYKLEAIKHCGGVSRIVRPSNLEEFLQEVREYAEHYFEGTGISGTIKEN